MADAALDHIGWAVVETRANAELLAERSLQRLGFRPLLIRYRKRLRGVRLLPDGRRVRSRSDDIVARPFLPGYLFLPLAQDDDAVLVDTDCGHGRPPGIKQLFRRLDRRPRMIRASIVEDLRIAARIKDEAPLTRQELLDRIEAGEKVAFRHPLGFTAIMVSLDDQDRADYFAWVFNREVRGSIKGIANLHFIDVDASPR